MITFNSLGRKGNLGNQLFHIASTVGIAKKYNQMFSFPEWEYSKYFEYEFPQLDKNKKLIQIVEKGYEFQDWEIGNEDYDINGALQSEKYFDVLETKKMFLFKPSFIEPLISKFNFLFDKEHIIISVRRGDFVNHPHYYQLPYKYYFLAMTENFSDWKDRNLIFMSDDINYCKHHFNFLPNAIFLENLSAIEQLAIATKGENFIISNSTFSWWAAWLGENEKSKVIRPIKNFRGSFAKNNNDKDYFPSRWIAFNYRKEKIQYKYLSLILKGELGRFGDYFSYLLSSIQVAGFKVQKRISKFAKL